MATKSDLQDEIEQLDNELSALTVSNAILRQQMARIVAERKDTYERDQLYGSLQQAVFGDGTEDSMYGSALYLLKEAYGLLKHKNMLATRHGQRMEAAIDGLNDLEAKLERNAP